MPSSSPNVNWDELPAADVLTILKAAAKGSGSQSVSGFLDIHQWLPLAGKPGLVIEGGHPAAHFRRAALGRDSVSILHLNIVPATLPENARSARGLRAYLQHLGIPVFALGDIAAGDYLHVCSLPDAFTNQPELALQKVTGWSPRTIKPHRFSMAANRLDTFVSGAFRVGRAEAQVAIKNGFVFVDFRLATKRTQQINAGNQIVFRTKGRAEILKMQPNPRSKRMMVEVSPFPA